MASITKRKSKYSVVYDYYDEEGVRHQKWETWGTYAEAKRRKAEIEHKQTNNTFVKPSIIRRVWLPETVARMLVDWKKQQEEQKRYLGSEYHDSNIVLALPNGRPMEGQVISRLFNAMIRKNDLPKVVFHSLRHSSTTYKLKLNNGDMKAVQGDTGHAQLKMVSDVYSHILDEDRRHNAEKMERDFYKKAEEKVSTEPTAKPTNAATEQLMNLLNSSPDLAAQLLQMLTANQTGQAVTA